MGTHVFLMLIHFNLYIHVLFLIGEGQTMPELSSPDEDMTSAADLTPYQRNNEELMTKEKESNARTIGKYLINFD